MDRDERLSETVENLLVRFGLSSVTAQIRLRRRWADVVGPLLSAKSSPASLRNGILTVTVLNHSWAQEMQLKKPLLIEKIDAVLGPGTVRDIRFAAGRRRRETPRREPGPAPGDPPAAAGPEPDVPGLENVKDPEMRAILRAIARKTAAPPGSRRS